MLAPQTELPLWIIQTFRSLRSRNYRTYAFSQLISNCGSWIQLTIISWLVLELTGSPFMLGLVNFLRLFPMAIFGFLGGWLADRFDRKSILIWTKIVMFLQATTLGLLTISGSLETWHVLTLAFLLGIANAIDMPAKQSITFNLVPKKDLINAVSLNTSSFHASRAIGPVIAIAIVYMLGQGLGEGLCFIINGFSFLFVVWALTRINLGSRQTENKSIKVTEGYSRSIRFIKESLNVRTVFFLGLISSLFCMQYIVMMPVFAKSVLGREIDGFGILMSGAALGSFCGALLLANKARTKEKLKMVIATSAIGFAFTIILFSQSTNICLSSVLAALIGLFSTSQLSASNSLIQTEVDDSIRGKVISVWMIFVVGIGPIGGVAVGWLTGIIGAPSAMAGCGVISLVLCTMALLYYRLNSKMIASVSAQ